MHAFAATGAGFLVAVLWFDLMFDVQARGPGRQNLSPETLASIAGYYRRVTTEASPMGQLVAAVMLATLAALVAEIVTHSAPPWIAWGSLVLAASAIALALARTVRNAAKLGRGADDESTRSRLARQILRDHVFCFTAMVAVAVLQLAVGA